MKTRIGPDGVHIFDRATGLNVLVDEVDPPPELWSPAPRYVSVALTNACDLKCPYCYAPKAAAALPIEQLKPWLADLDHGGCLGVGFGGGEPTLAREFGKLCEWTARNTGLAVSFTTHGHHITPSMRDALHGYVHFIRVSMDGVGKTYEDLRGRPFSRFVHQLTHIAEIAPFGINYVVNDRTMPELDAALTVAGERGASELLLLPEQPAGGRRGVTQATRVALEEWVLANHGRMRLSVSQAGMTDGMPTVDPFPREPLSASHVHIDATGALKLSSFEPHGQVIGGTPILEALQRLRAHEGERG